jgi:hypothetical protein
MKVPSKNTILEIKEYPKYPDEIGKQFGYLTVLYEIERNEKQIETIYACKCKCGKELLKFRGQLIYQEKRMKIQSCGCHRTEVISKIFRKHGDSEHCSGKANKSLKRLYRT